MGLAFYLYFCLYCSISYKIIANGIWGPCAPAHSAFSRLNQKENDYIHFKFYFDIISIPIYGESLFHQG